MQTVSKKPPEIVEKEGGKNKRYLVILYDVDTINYHESDVVFDILKIFDDIVPIVDPFQIVDDLIAHKEAICCSLAKEKAEEKRNLLRKRGYRSDIRMVYE